jgi:lipid-binding SYLF domain-containing protein
MTTSPMPQAPMPARRAFVRQCGAMLALPLLTLPLLTGGCSGVGPPSTPATRARRRQDIEADFLTTLERCYLAEPATRALIGDAVATLVFPTVVAINPVTGERSGDGALRVAQVFTAYYALSLATVAGAPSQSFIFLFMNLDALDRLRDAAPWHASEAVPVTRAGARLALPARTDVAVLTLADTRLVAPPPLAGAAVVRLDL